MTKPRKSSATHQLRLRDENGITNCCGAYTSIFEDGVEYCKKCYGAIVRW